MKKKFLLIWVVLVNLSLVFGQNTINLNSDFSEYTVSNNKSDGFVFNFSFNQIRPFEVQTSEGTFTQLSIAGFIKSYNVGLPDLPVMNKLIEVPYGAEVTAEIISYDEQIVKLSDYGFSFPVMPAQPSVSKSDKPEDLKFYYDKNAYTLNSFGKKSIISTEILGFMRGTQIGRISIAPVQYNPVKNELRVLNNLVIKIKFLHGDIVKSANQYKKFYSPYFEELNKKLINHSAFSVKDSIVSYPVKFVIVADPMFQSQLQNFIKWKTRKGFHVVEAYTNDASVGTTTASIKNYLQNLYNSATPTDPAPSFVLFVGDIEQIPAYSGTTGSHVSDLYYFTYDGTSDYFPEIYYGRFSAQTTAQLQSQIDKTMEYEQYTFPNPSYLNEVVMVAGVDATFGPTHANGQINYGTENYFNIAHGLTSYTYLYPASGSSDAQIISDISNGVGFANYTAHCSEDGWADPTFSRSDIPGLQNADEYSVMIGNCCLSNKFDESECFGEAILRADKKGAVGYIGGSNSTLWDEDFYWSVGVGTISATPTYAGTTLGAYDCLWHENGEPETNWYVTNGQIIFAGDLSVTEGGTSNILYYWEIYHLMGDPSVMAYLGVPAQLTISYLNTIPIGTPTLTVNTEPNTYVAISYNDVLYDAKYSNSSGVVELDMSAFTMPCEAVLVATKQFREPHFGTVMIVPNTSAYVVYQSNSIDDSAGNNNALADFGENVLLNVSLKNVGSLLATNVNATLSSLSTFIDITDNEELYGDINSDEIVTKNGAFAFTVHDPVPDQQNVQFSLLAKDVLDSNWVSNFSLKLNAPVLGLSFLNVDDSSTGNNNTRLDADETVNLNIDAVNNGHAASTSAICVLTSASPWVTINTDTVAIGTLAIGSSLPGAFSITIDPATPIGTAVDFNFNLIAGNYNAQKSVVLKVGLILEDWESNAFTSFQWQNNSAIPWIITSGSPYEGSFAAESGNIDDGQTTTLSIQLYVLNPDTISFYKMVSSEQDYDFLTFYIDGEEKEAWSGNVSWSNSSYAVTPGLRTFTWAYAKDESVSSGGDNAMIDYIILPRFDDSGNNLPVFTSIPITMNEPDVQYTYNITVDDADAGNTIVITCPTLPSWLSFTDNGNRTAILTGTPTTSDIGLHQVVLNAFDGIANITQSFTIGVGIPVEDWETGTLTQYPWITGGNLPWLIVTTGQYEGNDCVKSGAITHSQTSTFSINLNVIEDGEVSFYKKVSSESGYDYLTFYIDNVSQDAWSGTVDWSASQYTITTGVHELKWEYSKDGSVSSGSDCGWVDFIVFPSTDFITSINNSNVSQELTFTAFPNPVNNRLNVNYTLPVAGNVTLALYDMLGNKVKEVYENKFLENGSYSTAINVETISSGVYFLNFISKEKALTQKIVINK